MILRNDEFTKKERQKSRNYLPIWTALGTDDWSMAQSKCHWEVKCMRT